MKSRIVVKDEDFAEFLIKHRDNHEICAASPKVIMDRCEIEIEPENWADLIGIVIDEIKFCEEDEEIYMEKFIRENEFSYMGFNFSRKGEIHQHLLGGKRVSVLSGCSIKQMFLFLQILKLGFKGE